MTRSPITRLHMLMLPIALVVACGPGDFEGSVGSRQAAIVNGEPDTDHINVGILLAGPGDKKKACNGTLIDTRTVLTAAHCVTTESYPYEKLSPVEFYLGGIWGSRFEAEGVDFPTAFAGGDVADIAVVRLKEEVQSWQATPATLAQNPPMLKEKVTVVGYGLAKEGDDPSEFGKERRKATNRIDELTPTTFTMNGASWWSGEGNLCHGDSGGPTFAERLGKEVLIGVHTSIKESCGKKGTDMRVDFFYGWIANHSALTLSDGSPPEPEPELPPPFSGEYGEPCVTNGSCKSQLCIHELSKDVHFCSQRCNPSQRDCPEGSSCEPAGEFHVCVPPLDGKPDRSGTYQVVQDPVGGCSVGSGPGGDSSLSFLSFLILFLLLKRRCT